MLISGALTETGRKQSPSFNLATRSWVRPGLEKKNRQAARGTVRHLKYKGGYGMWGVISPHRLDIQEPRPVSTIAGAASHLAQVAPLLTILRPTPSQPAPSHSLVKKKTHSICHLVHLYPLNSASAGSCCYIHCFGPERLANSGFSISICWINIPSHREMLVELFMYHNFLELSWINYINRNVT